MVLHQGIAGRGASPTDKLGNTVSSFSIFLHLPRFCTSESIESISLVEKVDPLKYDAVTRPRTTIPSQIPSATFASPLSIKIESPSMPPRKSNSPSKPTSGRVLLGMEGKQRGGGTNQRIQASRPSNTLNFQRTQIVAAPALSAPNTSIVSHSWNPLRPLQRPIVSVPGVHTRILFSCDHEDEGKRAKDDVNEEVVHVENVDALDMGMGWEVEGGSSVPA